MIADLADFSLARPGDPNAHFADPLRARASISPRLSSSLSIERHLILAYRPRWQSPDDLDEIAARIREIDPAIRTFIVPTTQRNTVIRRLAAERPTLLVSPGQMPRFRPARGRIYAGSPIPKLEELRRLRDAGVAAPKTAILTPGLQLDPDEWGDFVLLKPTDIRTSSRGQGIQLMRTRRVRYREPQDYPEGHPGRLGPMMVQQYVMDEGHISVCRVLTLFGEPLYLLKHRSRDPVVDVSAPDEEIESLYVAHQGQPVPMEREFVFDGDAIAIARAAHAAIPEVPLKGCDLVYEARTRRFYVIELNCGGNTWHFSSAIQGRWRHENPPEFERMRRTHMDAMGTAARVLAERTRAEAA